MEKKNIVITGASEGIGAATARVLGAAGHRLMLSARREAEIKKVASECGEAVAFVGNMSKRGDVERLKEKAIAEFGKVDVWINNVGRGIDKHVLELTDEDVDEVILMNVKTALYGMQAIVPHFKERGSGHLLNLSSFLGKAPLAANRSIYSAAKAALNSLTANLRMDLKKDYPGIKVSLVMPGLTETNFAKNSIGSKPNSTPLPPPPPGMCILKPEEVAESIKRAIDEPTAEVFPNPMLGDVAKKYLADIPAFEAGLP